MKESKCVSGNICQWCFSPFKRQIRSFFSSLLGRLLLPHGGCISWTELESCISMFVVLGPSLSVFYPLRTLSSFSFSQANVLWHPSFTVEQCAFYLQHNALRNSQLSGLFLFPSDLCPRSPHLPIISTYWYLRLWSPFCAFALIPPESWTFTALDAFTQIAFPLPIPNDLNHLRVKTGKTIHVTPTYWPCCCTLWEADAHSLHLALFC